MCITTNHSRIPLSIVCIFFTTPIQQFVPDTINSSSDEEYLTEEDSDSVNNNESDDEYSDTTEGADLSYVLSDTEDENPLFLKCNNRSKSNKIKSQNHEEIITKYTQTLLFAEDIEGLVSTIESLQLMNKDHLQEIENLHSQIEDLNNRINDVDQAKGKLEKLASQNSILKEKSNDVRKENDLLVEKIQGLQKKLSMEVRVSVSEHGEDGTIEYCTPQFEEDPDDLFYSTKASSVGTPESGRDKARNVFPKRSPGPSSPSPRAILSEDFLRNEEKRFEEAAEKIMRLEQRIACLQKANNLNSCATCRPLRSHVMKIERQLLNLVQERKGQLEELYELKQEALSSAVGEKDAHLAWLEVSVSRDEIENVHTKGTIERLRRERKDLLQRMKEENENRMKLLSSLEDNSTLFTGPSKITSLGALGETYVSDMEEVDSGGLQSTSSLQSMSTGELGEINLYHLPTNEPQSLPSRAFDPTGIVDLDPAQDDDDKQSTKSC